MKAGARNRAATALLTGSLLTVPPNQAAGRTTISTERTAPRSVDRWSSGLTFSAGALRITGGYCVGNEPGANHGPCVSAGRTF